VKMDLEHMTDLLRPSPAQADAACSHVPLSGDARPAAPAGPPHTIRRNHGRCDAAVPPARPARARFPCRGRDLPARIRDGSQVARQGYQQRMVEGRCERIIWGWGS